MQREIKKKTITYGIAGVFLALLLTTIIYNVGIQPYIGPAFSPLKTFSSYDELRDFLTVNMKLAEGFQQPYLMPFFSDGRLLASKAETQFASGHSTTNVQVAGVDEADIVKTDGEYMYVVSGSNIYILKAYPPDQAKVLSKISLNETSDTEVYLSGDKLAVLGKNTTDLQIRVLSSYYYDWYAGAAFVKVYDISNKTNPVLTRTLTLNGSLSGSRMIGDYVYVVVNQLAKHPSSNFSEPVILPKILVNGEAKIIEPTEIRYLDIPDVFYYFTTVIAVNVMNDAQEPTYEPLLTGATASMYVSQSNMYLAIPNTSVWLTTFEAGGAKEETIICRAKLDGKNVVFEAQGSVTGNVLNQFSMDEYNGFFRIATTNGWGTTTINNLYVLNMSLSIVGTLSNIAPGERIYSARFMGDKCYLVTFLQTDPFFVIDVSNPIKPRVLGYLKIPGFSGYLHPYDENHIIGVGKEGSSVKLSLFDVSNVSAPTEAVPSYIVPLQWSDTTVLSDHKAFLFDKAKQLLALPVQGWIKEETGENNYAYWQGAYVFDITLTSGFVLKGTVTHYENSTNLIYGNYLVTRTLYIDNVFYTVSDRKMKMNSLEDLTLIKEIELN